MQWQKARHLLSDRLYESYNFWIEAYKREHLQNKLDNLSIKKIDMAAIEVDKYYEAFTVRIFASCYDYVINQEGKVLGGSRKKARYFSEYWTFMRRNGVEIKESEFSLHNCPNCGAPADKMGQAAVCEYCGAKISNGDFSWILTRIVQDEEY
jgi:ribosomal protein L37AE/L43A